MSSTLSQDLTRIYSARGADGLNRLDRRNLAIYNRTQYLFDKFLTSRKSTQTLQLTHEHILDLGDKSLRKLEQDFEQRLRNARELSAKSERERIQAEFEAFKEELKKRYLKQFEEAKERIKNDYEELMKRMERLRDEAEEKRVKELISRMNDECEEALRRQWSDAEAYRLKCLEEMRETMRREILEEKESEIENAVKLALKNAEEAYKIREKEAVERMRLKCKQEADEKIEELCDRYDKSIEALVFKVQETEDKWRLERERREKFEKDFRLLQADYKRFMNYTEHYNSDYMMKLRHIGANLLDDDEYEKKLDERIDALSRQCHRSRHHHQ